VLDPEFRGWRLNPPLFRMCTSEPYYSPHTTRPCLPVPFPLVLFSWGRDLVSSWHFLPFARWVSSGRLPPHPLPNFSPCWGVVSLGPPFARRFFVLRAPWAGVPNLGLAFKGLSRDGVPVLHFCPRRLFAFLAGNPPST